MPGPRVLYLHGLRGGPRSIRQQLLEQAYGKENVSSPNLKTRRTLVIFTILFVLYVLALAAGAFFSFYYWSPIGGALITVLLFLIACVTYVLAGRGVTHYMVVKAVQIAEKTFTQFRPNVIVASSFGSIVALNLKAPRVGLVMLAPAQDAYCRYMKIRELYSLDGWPYAIIIHGSRDDSINLDDSIRLVETSDFGKCKLEVIDDDHKLSTLSEGDFRDFVSEAYSRGREEVLLMVRQHLNLQKGAVPLVDATLYDIKLEEEADTPVKQQGLTSATETP